MIEFLSTDPQNLLTQAVKRFEQVAGEALLPGDERYQFLSQQIQAIVSCREQINYTAVQNLLRYAQGTLLDEYGGQYDVKRLSARTASVTMKFQLMTPLSFPVEIPVGTRVTPDGHLNFVTSRAVEIVQGEDSVQVLAVAEFAGAEYNNFLPNQICSIVDPVANISSAANVDTSLGGTDEESDDSYRERIRQSWEGISTCGSKESYEFFARTASSEIVDVEAVNSQAGKVTLYVLQRGAEQPSEELLAEVLAQVNSDKRRPLTDHVTVLAAVPKHYNIELTYYIQQSDSTEETAIRRAVERAVTQFKEEQKKRLGKDINPDTLRHGILQAGGYRIDIVSPVYTELLAQEVAVAQTVTLKYGGLL